MRSAIFQNKKQQPSNGRSGCRSFFGLLLLLIVGLIIGYFIARQGQDGSSTNMCTTKGCVSVANTILQSMNESVDRCESFYDYACGNWKNAKFIPHHTTEFSPTHLNERYRIYFMSIFRSEAEADRVLSQAYLFYRKCISYIGEMNLIEDEIIHSTVQLIGHFPELGIKTRNFDLTDAMIAMAGLEIDFGLGIVGADRPVFRFNGSVSPILGCFIPFKEMDSSTIGVIHRTIIAKIIVLFNKTGEDVDMKTIKAIMPSLIKFHQKVAKNFPGTGKLQNFTVGAIQEALPMINIKRLLKSLSYPDTTLEISDSTVIPSLSTLEDYRKLNQLLQEVDPSVLRHYLLDVIFAKSFNNQFTPESGLFCYYEMQSKFIAPITGLYGRIFTKPDERAVAAEMTKDIIDATIETLQESEWMDEKTKEYAVDKAKKMGQCIAYPDEFIDPKKVAEGYEYINLHDNDTYIEMIRKIKQLETHITYKLVSHPVDRSLMCRRIETAVMNAAYYPRWNIFVIHSRILQEPMFDMTFPKIHLYAAIGSVIGHEIMHGFDQDGRNFDAEGYKNNWWTPAIGAEFDRRKKCFINQYNQMISDGIRENGTNSIGENIADNAGLSVAIKALKRLIERKPENNIILPGLEDFTPEQMFFLSFGQMHCSVATRNTLMLQLQDVHAFARNRINGPVTNHKEFAEAFHCKPGSKHNPKDEERCVLW